MSMDWPEYEGVNALVTGAASGMGAAVTKLLLAAGARVTAVDVREPAGGVRFEPCDLRHPGEIRRLASSVEPPQVVFACAGVPNTFPAEEVFAVNFLANRLLIETLALRMSEGGAIVTVASLLTGWDKVLPVTNLFLSASTFEEGLEIYRSSAEARAQSPYIFSKYALIGWTFVSAEPFLSRHGLRLNVICPGRTDTPMMPEFRRQSAAEMDALPNPIARMSTPDEQAQAMLFANSRRASYLAGAAIAVDGGLSAALAAAQIAATRQA